MNKEQQFSYTRRISLENDFMNYTTDDLLYGLMTYLATFHPLHRELYLTKQNYEKNRKLLYDFTGTKNSTNLKNHLNKLIQKGLVAEKNYVISGEKVSAYYFPYDKNGKYRITDSEMLFYLTTTRNQQVIRVYTYLLDVYLWKKEEDDYFVFTNKDILKKLGYSTNNKNASAAISNILESLSKEGIIKYEDYYETYVNSKGESLPTPKKRLLFVASKKDEIL